MKALYLETSAALAWLFGEPSGDRARAAMDVADVIFTSSLTLVEASRATVVARRSGRLGAEHATKARRLLRHESDAWNLLEIDASIRSRAGDMFPVEPLRTLDALHLATVLRLAGAFPDLSVLSFDDRILKNLEPLGLQRA